MNGARGEPEHDRARRQRRQARDGGRVVITVLVRHTSARPDRARAVPAVGTVSPPLQATLGARRPHLLQQRLIAEKGRQGLLMCWSNWGPTASSTACAAPATCPYRDLRNSSANTHTPGNCVPPDQRHPAAPDQPPRRTRYTHQRVNTQPKGGRARATARAARTLGIPASPCHGLPEAFF